MHGTGAWDPILLASGLQNFAMAMREIARLADRRENPVRLEENPIEPGERTNLINRIQQENGGIDMSFWENWLASE